MPSLSPGVPGGAQSSAPHLDERIARGGVHPAKQVAHGLAIARVHVVHQPPLLLRHLLGAAGGG